MVTISPTLEMLAGSEGTPTYHFVKLVQREMQKASIQAVTLCYIQIFVTIMTLLATDGMDLELDGSLRSQIFDHWTVFEVLGHSLRRQMRSEMPSLEFNYYDYNNPPRVKWGSLHIRYPQVFKQLQQGARISIFDMQKAEVLFNALEACRALLNIIGANPQLAVDMFADYYSEADKINPVHRAVVIVKGASPETGGQLHPQTRLRSPFWWKMVVTPIPEDFLNSIPTKLLEFPVVYQDTSLRSSWSDSVSDFSFDRPRDTHHRSIGSESTDDEREDVEEITPKIIISEFLNVSPDATSRCCKDDAAKHHRTPSVHPLVIGRSLRLLGTSAPNIGSALNTPRAPATLDFSNSPGTKEKMTPCTTTSKLSEMASEQMVSLKREDSIQALIEQLIEEEDGTRTVESAKSFSALVKHGNNPIEESNLVESESGFIHITVDRPTLIRVSRPAPRETCSNKPPNSMDPVAISEPHVFARSHSGATVTRNDATAHIRVLGVDQCSRSDPAKCSATAPNNTRIRSIRFDNTSVPKASPTPFIRRTDAQSRSIKAAASTDHQARIEPKLKKRGFLSRLNPMRHVTGRRSKD